MKDTAMHNLTLAEIARNLAEKRCSAEELTRTLLARIPKLHFAGERPEYRSNLFLRGLPKLPVEFG